MTSSYTIVCWLPLCAVLLLADKADNACPRPCDCQLELDRVDCSGANLNSIPWNLPQPGTLKEIILNRNSIQVISSEIVSYPSLDQLDLSENHIRIINSQVFQGLKSLQTLNLQDNQLSHITQDIFLQHNSSLLDLNLSNNDISTIDDNAFSSLRKLTVLRLTNNYLTQIRKEIFNGLVSLQELHLTGNSLTSIHSDVFQPLFGLTELYLDKNRIENLSDHNFVSLIHLKVLGLEGNSLERLPEHLFASSKQPALQKLSIKHNRLGVVPSNSLRHLTQLQTLDISENPFISIIPDAFASLQDLRVLIINSCVNLTVIREYSFSSLIQLERVNISFNPQLSEIQPGAFIDSQRLRHVRMTHNALHTIDAELIKWSALETLELTGNQWLCDCALQFLPKVLLEKRNQSNRAHFATAYCSLPERLAERDVTTVEDIEFNCDNHYTDSTFGGAEAAQFSSTIMIAIICTFAGALLTCLAFLIWRTRDVSFHNSSSQLNHVSHRRRRLRKINREYTVPGRRRYDIGEGPRIVSANGDKLFAQALDDAECGVNDDDDDDVFLNDPDIVTSSNGRAADVGDRYRTVSFSDRVVVRTYESIEEIEESFDGGGSSSEC